MKGFEKEIHTSLDAANEEVWKHWGTPFGGYVMTMIEEEHLPEDFVEGGEQGSLSF